MLQDFQKIDEQLQSKLEDLARQIQELEEQAAVLQAEAHLLSMQRSALNAEAEAQQSIITGLEQGLKLAQLDYELAEATGLAEVKQASVTQAEQALDGVQLNIRNLHAHIADIRDAEQALQSRMAEIRTQVSSLQTERRTLESARERYHAEHFQAFLPIALQPLIDAKHEVSDLETRLDEARACRDEAQAQLITNLLPWPSEAVQVLEAHGVFDLDPSAIAMQKYRDLHDFVETNAHVLDDRALAYVGRGVDWRFFIEHGTRQQYAERLAHIRERYMNWLAQHPDSPDESNYHVNNRKTWAYEDVLTDLARLDEAIAVSSSNNQTRSAYTAVYGLIGQLEAQRIEAERQAEQERLEAGRVEAERVEAEQKNAKKRTKANKSELEAV